jgi:Lon protease-like protein
MSVLPMFPLGSVLLPGGVLTLHVFEPRYRALVAACIESPSHEFGTVLIERGSEVGGGDVRRDVGTVAQMVQVAELPDGRFAVVAVGTRRLRVRSWLADDPYPTADADEWPEEWSADDADRRDLIAAVGDLVPRVRRAAALALELGDPIADAQQEIGGDPLLAVYQLVSLAPLGDVDRYDLLCAPGPLARLELLHGRLIDVEALLRFRLGSD